jgi:plasmid stabilization system protein ParE
MLFASAIRRAEQLALGNPHGFSRIAQDPVVRTIVVRGFPYRLLYVVRRDDIVVVAIAHTSRSVERLLRR